MLAFHIGQTLQRLWNDSGVNAFFVGDGWKSLVMIVIACVLLYLGIVKKFEPLLLVGIAFGCLREDASIDRERNARMISIIHSHGKEAVFHRAFDCTSNPYESIETLIELGTDRLLTSGLKPKAVEGKALLGALQSAYGNSIEILAGSGINVSNARNLMEETGIRQVHSSCKDWMTDPTTTSNGVTYGFAEPPHENSYDVVSQALVRQLLDSLGALGR